MKASDTSFVLLLLARDLTSQVLLARGKFHHNWAGREGGSILFFKAMGESRQTQCVKDIVISPIRILTLRRIFLRMIASRRFSIYVDYGAAEKVY